MKKVVFDIVGMHCSSCAMNIDFDLEDMNGVKSSKTNYAKQKCEVEFDDSLTNEEEIAKQIGETGYSAELTN